MICEPVDATIPDGNQWTSELIGAGSGRVGLDRARQFDPTESIFCAPPVVRLFESVTGNLKIVIEPFGYSPTCFLQVGFCSA